MTGHEGLVFSTVIYTFLMKNKACGRDGYLMHVAQPMKVAGAFDLNHAGQHQDNTL